MDLVSIILFLIMYYVRPHEWAGFLNSLRPVKLTVVFAIFAMFSRDRPVEPKDFFRTPHDWMMYTYWLWIVFSSPTPFQTFQDTVNLVVFYVIIVQALSSMRRIELFLGWWTMLIVFIAALSVASLYGFDPLHSKDVTDNSMKGRLVLNLSIFNNPNALAHSVVPALPMLFFFCWWKRPLFMRWLGAVVITLPLSCIYLTISKGAFVSGFATIFTTLTFGRPKVVQFVICIFAVMFGWAALYSLPRMNELNKSKSDEAIRGRIAAYKYGLNALETRPRGIGYGNFIAEFIRTNHYLKASHGSYNNVGAELGKTGLYLFLGVLYCGFRTVLSAKTYAVEEERIRRILFVILVSYVVSSWMVDFGYRATYFMFSAAIAAFHRQLLPEERETEPEEEAEAPAWRRSLQRPGPAPMRLPQPAAIQAPAVAMLMPVAGSFSSQPIFRPTPLPTLDLPPDPEDETPKHEPMTWNRLGLVDFFLIYCCLDLVIRYWRYIIQTM